MCGIFGVIVKKNAPVKTSFIQKSLYTIAKYSQSRGKDSSGIVFKNNLEEKFNLIKGDIPVTELQENSTFKKYLTESLGAFSTGNNFQAIGHARLVTNGSQLLEENNQPVIKDGIIGIHNGIIINVDELWEDNPDITRTYDIDTEILLALIRSKLNKEQNLIQSISSVLNSIEGTVSTALLFDDRSELVLATNNGSLFYLLNDNFLIFASEEFFLNSLMKKLDISLPIKQIKSFSGLVLNTESFANTEFQQREELNTDFQSTLHNHFKVIKTNVENATRQEVVIDPSVYINRNKEAALFELLEDNEQAINKLVRCTKCILPETFPFIYYDEKGVCNYCKSYKPQEEIKGYDKLLELVEPYRSNNGKSDCIVPFSGGRDSTYSLHIVKNELGLNPITFTYDWGMVTDLARRNIARICGKMGVENIIVSADIRWKRENIRKNITAWLKKPELGMIPLFMAGDKYFFYYCDRLKKQTGIDLNIWGINNLENTNFKTGFAGIAPSFNKKRIYSLSLNNQIRLFSFVAKNIVGSPGYFNQSIFDSLGSFAVRYLSPKKDYFHLFDYYKWDETEVEDLIKNEYKWEIAIDTKSTWRIGDGTASFYNYVYNTVAGFNENDTFRSNQIRENMITRDQAMGKIYEENLPRYETLRWYLEIVGLDYIEVIQTVNKIPKLYRP